MEKEYYLKGACEHCGAHIEFPSQGVGQTIPCPHCGQKTILQNPAAPPATSVAPASSQKRVPVFVIALGGLALLAAIGWGIVGANKKRSARAEIAISPTTVEGAALQNAPAITQPPTKLKKPAALPQFESNHLQAFRVALEKSQSSRLIYATGAIRNQSSRQRFGVKVELDLLDEQGAKLGTATDYVQIIEPRKQWKFRAMVTEPNAVRAKVTAITEE